MPPALAGGIKEQIFAGFSQIFKAQLKGNSRRKLVDYKLYSTKNIIKRLQAVLKMIKKIKQKENETVTNCYGLKMRASDFILCFLEMKWLQFVTV